MSLISMKITDAIYFELEPGDLTHYEFVVMDGICKNNRYVTIARGIDGAQFFGTYCYLIDEVKSFFKDYPELINATKEEYQGLVQKPLRESNFVKYIIDHSRCNPYTAVASLIAMNHYIDVRGGLK